MKNLIKILFPVIVAIFASCGKDEVPTVEKIEYIKKDSSDTSVPKMYEDIKSKGDTNNGEAA